MKNSYLFYIVFSLFIVYQLVTLDRAPCPWFDEVFYADISYNLLQTDEFNLSLFPHYINGQVYIYGPIFFILQSIIIEFI